MVSNTCTFCMIYSCRDCFSSAGFYKQDQVKT
uniref:Uncharacterized protein n=1 Tax=Anguilla anguilla TaxID=7936 RepID=A0A0E9VX86_ANGAN